MANSTTTIGSTHATPSMENMAYGIDEAGITKLKQEFGGDFTKARNAVKGDSYHELVNTIANNWSGEDCDAFLRKLEQEVGNIYYLYGQTLNLIKQALDDKALAFKKFQNSHARSLFNNTSK